MMSFWTIARRYFVLVIALVAMGSMGVGTFRQNEIAESFGVVAPGDSRTAHVSLTLDRRGDDALDIKIGACCVCGPPDIAAVENDPEPGCATAWTLAEAMLGLRPDAPPPPPRT